MSGSIALFANNATSVLAAGISSTATTALLASGTGVLFPSPGANQYFALTFISASNPQTREIVFVTSMDGDTIAAMVRGQEGTSPLSWLPSDLAQALITAGSFTYIANAATKITPNAGTTTISGSTITSVVGAQTNTTTINGGTITTVYGPPTSQTWQTVISGSTVTTTRTA